MMNKQNDSSSKKENIIKEAKRNWEAEDYSN